MNAVNKIEQHNPIGTDGFEFVEFTAPNAEGIEQQEQASFLLQEQCQLGQGYWFGRPVPAQDLDWG